MSGHEADRDEIDLLVRDLATKPLPPVRPAGAQAVEAAAPVERRPGSRWTNVRLQMTARPAPGRTHGLLDRMMALSALIPAWQVPQAPDLRRYIRMPSSIAIIRMWVTLGALHSASMTFWPYPKTYFWGQVFYILSLGLVGVTGVWGARLSWEARLGAAHTVAVSTVLWAVTLVTADTLPLM